MTELFKQHPKRILCPTCLEMVEYTKVDPGDIVERTTSSPVLLYRCKNPPCKAEIPIRYIRDYGEFPPLVFSLVGFAQHGKTTYLDALLIVFDRIRKTKPWTSFSWMPLDESQMVDARKKLRVMMNRVQPALTDEVFSSPLIVQLKGVPQIGRCNLLLCDTRGESFKFVETTMTDAYYAARGEVVVWLLSLFDPIFTDPTDEAGESSPEPWLLDKFDPVSFIGAYVQAALALGRDPKEQSLIIVLTKADLMVGDNNPITGGDALEPGKSVSRARTHQLPRRIREYIQGEVESWDMRALRRLSRDIKGWLDKSTPYGNFVQLASTQFKHVEYCVVSSLGASPEKSHLRIHPLGRGVLAPLLWAGKLQRKGMARARTHTLKKRLQVIMRAVGRSFVLGAPTSLLGILFGGGFWSGLAAIDQLAQTQGVSTGIVLGLADLSAVGAAWGAGVFGLAGVLWALREKESRSPVLSMLGGALGGILLGALVNATTWILTHILQDPAAFSFRPQLVPVVDAAMKGAYLGAAIGAMWGGATWWIADKRFFARSGVLVSLIFGSVASYLLAGRVTNMAADWTVFAATSTCILGIWLGKYHLLARRHTLAPDAEDKETAT